MSHHEDASPHTVFSLRAGVDTQASDSRQRITLMCVFWGPDFRKSPRQMPGLHPGMDTLPKHAKEEKRPTVLTAQPLIIDQLHTDPLISQPHLCSAWEEVQYENDADCDSSVRKESTVQHGDRLHMTLQSLLVNHPLPDLRFFLRSTDEIRHRYVPWNILCW